MRLSSIYIKENVVVYHFLNIVVIFHFWKNWGHLPFLRNWGSLLFLKILRSFSILGENEVVFHLMRLKIVYTQIFKTLGQTLLQEIRWGLFLLFLFLLLRESKVNSQFWTGLGVWQNSIIWSNTLRSPFCYFFTNFKICFGYNNKKSTNLSLMHSFLFTNT